ncbi:MAG: glutamine-hydrolyzing GMP synthase [Planctomycetia bacterium]|nr:glutamine-hydrolyzing GMP synthase [Planctomycetia bacterium]
MPANSETVVIIDFGSQYSQLIARRVREQNVFCQILPHTVTAAELRKIQPVGMILSGGPASVYDPAAPRCDPELVKLGIPMLGICYGMQIGCQMLGGDVAPAVAREFGPTKLEVLDKSDLFLGLPDDLTVWMSHGDQVHSLGEKFVAIARTLNCPAGAVKHKQLPFYGVQFHPEVSHTPRGAEMIHNFLYQICRCKGKWQIGDFIADTVESIRTRVGSSRVICGLSGGVDSSVTAALVHKAIGDQLTCIFVNNGLLRLNEAELVEKTFRDNFSIDLRIADASERFLSRLKGVTDPQEKRRIIGHEFIEVFKDEAKGIPDARFLAQGTLYPDVIESGLHKGGPQAVIKLHHNVGGLPEELGFELIEPLRDLFKDEVREAGRLLGLPDEIVWRHPFPGPGLAVRIVGEVTEERLELLRQVDAIAIEEIRRAGLYRSIGQAFMVLLPVSTVGVMGDERSYEYVVALRAVEATDYMTADWFRMPSQVLADISSRVINEVRGVNRVVYDISSKPPSTIEWE